MIEDGIRRVRAGKAWHPDRRRDAGAALSRTGCAVRRVGIDVNLLTKNALRTGAAFQDGLSRLAAMTTLFIHAPVSALAPRSGRPCAALAAAYRTFAMLGWNELIYNHYLAAGAGRAEALSGQPVWLHYTEVTASNLAEGGC